MQVVGLISRKGGSGKTTLATTLAVMGEQAGLRSLLVDLDPQGSSAAWWKARDAATPPLVETRPGRLKDILEGAEGDNIDLVVVDARPSVERDVAHVASLADLVLVPTRPAVFDLRAILGTLDIVREAACRALIVLNACPPPRGAGEASVVVDARHALAAFGVPVAPTAIVNRSAFPAAALAGLSVTELEPDGKAAKETRALWRAVEKELHLNGKANTGRGASDKAGRAGPARAGNGNDRAAEARTETGSRHPRDDDQTAGLGADRIEGDGGREASPDE
jgi:chromosome partitioning protein